MNNAVRETHETVISLSATPGVCKLVDQRDHGFLEEDVSHPHKICDTCSKELKICSICGKTMEEQRDKVLSQEAVA